MFAILKSKHNYPTPPNAQIESGACVLRFALPIYQPQFLQAIVHILNRAQK